MNTPAWHRGDRGFTLVEILLVMVIVGILASVTAYTVNGLSTRGHAVAEDSDEGILTTAQEVYFAQNGRYATEEQLVSYGLLRGRSTQHDIVVASDGQAYTLVPQAPTTTTATTTP